MNGSQQSKETLETLRALNDEELQGALLQGVSRTFALTIPQLPESLYPVVANAYLLCRIVDTIEDEVSLDSEQKKYFCSAFIDVVKTGEKTQEFADELAPLLSTATLEAEHQLIHLTARVIQITHGFESAQHHALLECVKTMAEGMPVYQSLDLHAGLKTMSDMDQYCYYVAGCVGEMLTRLFCHYSEQINHQHDDLLKLSVSFGQGLQMTNILKDIWDDAKRDVCWLPQDIFNETGYQLANLSAESNNEQFQKGLERLVDIAHQHLANAMKYTQMLPANETGLRKFCLWAIGMAVLTLRNIKNDLAFNDSDQVKISRRDVKNTVMVSQFVASNNYLLSMLFNLYSKKLKTQNWEYLPDSATN